MKKFLQIFIILITAVLWTTVIPCKSLAEDQMIWEPSPLSNLIDEGLKNNQKIQSLKDRINGLKNEAVFAGSLNDPRIGLTILNLPVDTLSFDQENMTQKQIFIAQKIPWFGKLSLQSKKMVLKAIRQKAVLKARQLELARQIATHYYQLGFIAHSQKINDKLIGLLNQILRVSETRYAAGKGLQQDVLQVQVELSKLLNEKISLSRSRRDLEDRLHGLLNRKNFTSIQPPENLPYPDLVLKEEELKNRVIKKNPWLEAKRVEIDQTVVDIDLARKDYYPDMDFKVAYGQRDSNEKGQERADFFSTSVVFNVPFWHKKRQDKKLAASRINHEAAVKAYKNLATSLPHKIDALVNDINNIKKNYRLITDATIVQAGQWARSSLAAYEVGKIEFNTMIKAQIRLLRFELLAENYLFSLYKKRAELEEVLGKPLSTVNAGKNIRHFQKENKL